MAQQAQAPAEAGGGGATGGGSGRAFVTYGAYGLFAGTVLGLGSMAFYQKPFSRKRNVAIGASLGLYAGLLYGAYRTYQKPGAGGGTQQPQRGNDPLNLQQAPAGRDGNDPLGIGGGGGAWLYDQAADAPTLAMGPSARLSPYFYADGVDTLAGLYLEW